MSPDDPYPAATLRVVISDATGHRLRKPALVRWLQAVAPARARGALALALVSDDVMRHLNRRYAGKDRPTDVLSFSNEGVRRRTPDSGLQTPDCQPGHLGDIAIATGVAARQARAAGHSLETELRILALHGLLHLLGYDHAVDDGTMARLERRLRRKGGLREGLIDRAGRAGGAGGAGGAGLPRRSVPRKASDLRRRAKAGRAGKASGCGGRRS